MAKPGVKITVDKWKQVAEGVRLLADTRVMVGIPQDRTERQQAQGLGNADLGYIHENGAPEVGIPARPFLVPGVQTVQPRIEKDLANAGRLAMEGKTESVMRQFHALGLRAQAAVRGKITSGPFAPLAAGTIAARKRRGRTGTKPLIDTGQLRAAINYVIRTIRGER